MKERARSVGCPVTAPPTRLASSSEGSVMSSQIRILVVDDHALFRGTLVAALQGQASVTVVASVPDATQAVEAARRLEPDVILMDILMPGLCCFEAARTIRREGLQSRIIFLSSSVEDHHIEQFFGLDAAGYLLKTTSFCDLLQAIQQVKAGRRVCAPEVRSRIPRNERCCSPIRKSRTRRSLLTEREIEVLKYVASGLPKKQIAGLMHVSVRTVDTHVRNIMKKLDLHDRVLLTRYAFREGLVALEGPRRSLELAKTRHLAV